MLGVVGGHFNKSLDAVQLDSAFGASITFNVSVHTNSTIQLYTSYSPASVSCESESAIDESTLSVYRSVPSIRASRRRR